MITELHIENLKCLRDVTLSFAPFTVLIGANDSGKSSILDAIRILGRTAKHTIPAAFGVQPKEQGAADSLFFRGDTTQRIVLSARAKSEIPFSYRLELSRTLTPLEEQFQSESGLTISLKEGHVEIADQENLIAEGPLRADASALYSALQTADREDLHGMIQSLANSERYHFDTRDLRKPSAPELAPMLSPSGDNLAAVLDDLLTGPDREAARALESSLCEAFPALSGIALKTLSLEGGRVLRGIELPLVGSGKRAFGVPSAHASDGALLMTAFLALAHGNTPDILLLEEPAAGLHPNTIPRLVEIFRLMSRGELGQGPRQVIVATHNPVFLNSVSPSEVRLLQREPKLGTRALMLSEIPNIERLLFGVGIGDIWQKLGEEGFLRQFSTSRSH